MENSFGDKGS
jgi:Ran GTPase-activating protein (RanGAP) involved in mRNA processing and transport